MNYGRAPSNGLLMEVNSFCLTLRSFTFAFLLHYLRYYFAIVSSSITCFVPPVRRTHAFANTQVLYTTFCEGRYKIVSYQYDSKENG